MVRQAGEQEIAILAELAGLLWKDASKEALTREVSEILAGGGAQFFLKWEGGLPVGFAQCQLRRDYVEGTETSPVGYMEGIFVQEAFRRRGYARELLEACQRWAKAQGCGEFASDCEIGNQESLSFHKAAGFLEANRIICFVKKL